MRLILRVQLHISLLKAMNCIEAVPTIKKFLSHPQHYIRWYAMQQLLGLDALLVLEELEFMAKSDIHEEVRFAATQTWNLVQEQLLKRHHNRLMLRKVLVYKCGYLDGRAFVFII